jgi:adenosylcobyric acid synthase
LHDPNAIEHETACTELGFGLIDDNVIYQLPKILKRGSYHLFSSVEISGYEIHCGRLAKYPLFYQHNSLAGTHVHGVFDDDKFRNQYFRQINPNYLGYHYSEYREQQIQNFADSAAEHLNIDAIIKALQKA